MHALLLAVLITVTGQGHATAAPDLATENFTIATNAGTAAGASSDNNARYARLLAALTAIGIAHADVRTASYSLSYSPPPQAAPDVRPTGQRYGYFVNRSIEVTVRSLGSIGKAVDSAVASGVTDIGGVGYGVRDTAALSSRALTSAVSDARSQAQAMAAAAGLRIVRIKSMQQGFASAPVPRMMMASAMPAPAPPTDIQPSSVQADATVTLVYEAQ